MNQCWKVTTRDGAEAQRGECKEGARTQQFLLILLTARKAGMRNEEINVLSQIKVNSLPKMCFSPSDGCSSAVGLSIECKSKCCSTALPYPGKKLHLLKSPIALPLPRDEQQAHNRAWSRQEMFTDIQSNEFLD